jgi:hypothetical protein
MRPTRRELLGAAGAGGLAGLAGCVGTLTEDGAGFTATAAVLPTAVQEDTGYTHFRTTEETVTEEFERFGFSRSVEVTNGLSEYDRALELDFLGVRVQAAVFATLSTPQVSILGRSFNPVAELSTAEIAEKIQQRYENVENVREEASFEAPVAGETATVTRFVADARLVEAGTTVEVYLYVNEAVELGEDFLVALASHPRAFGEQRDTVRALLAGVEQGAPSADDGSTEGEGT